MENETYGFDMPTPCQRCGGWFDLHDGLSSDKWFPNTVICEKCGEEEEKEIDTERRIDELKDTISDSKITIEDALTELVEAENELKGYSLPGGGHATFTKEPDQDTWQAILKMVELAKEKVK